MIREMNEFRESSNVAMKSAHDRAKHYVDNKRFFCEFEMGDKVFWQVPNRFGFKLGKSRKLSPRFCGPFEVLKMIGQVAYKLKLHEDWNIHNVFHLGLLRKYVSDPQHILLNLPKVVPEGELLDKPEKILKIEIQHLRIKMFYRFYMKWKDCPEE